MGLIINQKTRNNFKKFNQRNFILLYYYDGIKYIKLLLIIRLLK